MILFITTAVETSNSGLLFGLLLIPEDGGSMLLKNIVKLVLDYGGTFRRIVLVIVIVIITSDLALK
jgi:hypothetical protein